jgi:hypothetical protein
MPDGQLGRALGGLTHGGLPLGHLAPDLLVRLGGARLVGTLTRLLRLPGGDTLAVLMILPGDALFFSGRRREEIDLTKVRPTQANSGL